MTKIETALRVIAGITPAWAQWKVFFEDQPHPERDKGIELVGEYHDRISAIVRNEACRWMAEHTYPTLKEFHS